SSLSVMSFSAAARRSPQPIELPKGLRPRRFVRGPAKNHRLTLDRVTTPSIKKSITPRTYREFRTRIETSLLSIYRHRQRPNHPMSRPQVRLRLHLWLLRHFRR